MFGFKKRAAEMRRKESIIEAGRQAGESLMTAVETFLDRRLAEISNNLLDVLRQRFATIYDQPEHSPRLIADIELKIFNERLGEFPARLHEQVNEGLREWLKVADQLDARAMIDQHIANRINQAAVSLRLRGIEMLAEVVAQITATRP